MSGHINVPINIQEIKEFIGTMSSKDIKLINIPKSTLYAYKKNVESIYNAKLKNILILANYIQNQVTYIGIDLGTKTYMAASNIDRTKTYIDKTKEIEHFLNKYKNRKHQKNYDNEIAYSKLKTSLYNHISKNVNYLIKVNTGKTIYVLGEVPNYRASIFSLIFDLTYNILKDRIKAYDEVILVNEDGTSIHCPNCGYSHKNNRTKRNHFYCSECEFYFENDDILAASNIAKTAYEQYINTVDTH